jgi:hypothetical protein
MRITKALRSGWAVIFDRKRADDGNGSEHLGADTSVSQQQNEKFLVDIDASADSKQQLGEIYHFNEK